MATTTPMDHRIQHRNRTRANRNAHFHHHLAVVNPPRNTPPTMDEESADLQRRLDALLHLNELAQKDQLIFNLREELKQYKATIKSIQNLAGNAGVMPPMDEY